MQFLIIEEKNGFADCLDGSFPESPTLMPSAQIDRRTLPFLEELWFVIDQGARTRDNLEKNLTRIWADSPETPKARVSEKYLENGVTPC